MTTKEYLQLLEKKNPFYCKEQYEGVEDDKKAIRDFNRNLTNKYPWLVPRNRWTGKVVDDYNYEYTELDCMPEGWRAAFGNDICEEIRQALLKAQEADPNGGYDESWITTNYDSNKIIPYIYGYRVNTIKEKYGGLRWYDDGAPKEVYDIISKYETISYKTCIRCGEPAEWISNGWISPYCTDCAKNLFDYEEQYAKENYKSYKLAQFENRFVKINEFYKDEKEAV